MESAGNNVSGYVWADKRGRKVLTEWSVNGITVYVAKRLPGESQHTKGRPLVVLPNIRNEQVLHDLAARMAFLMNDADLNPAR